jgi:peptide chain release factor 3
VDPVARPFSGFVFKIQANMDPDHRDRIAFLRICSGRFVKDATTQHVRTGKRVRLARSTLLMAREREEIEEAFPGDVVGLFDPGIFRIGDTLSDEGGFHYPGIPTFSPEHFARVVAIEPFAAGARARISPIVVANADELVAPDRAGEVRRRSGYRIERPRPRFRW